MNPRSCEADVAVLTVDFIGDFDLAGILITESTSTLNDMNKV